MLASDDFHLGLCFSANSLWSTRYFKVLPNVGRVKSSVDDLTMERGTVSMRVALCYDLLRFSLCSWICVMTYGVVNSILWCCYQSSPLKKQSITPQIPLLSDSGLAKSNENIGLVTEQLTVVRCVVGISMPTSYLSCTNFRVSMICLCRVQLVLLERFRY